MIMVQSNFQNEQTRCHENAPTADSRPCPMQELGSAIDSDLKICKGEISAPVSTLNPYKIVHDFYNADENENKNTSSNMIQPINDEAFLSKCRLTNDSVRCAMTLAMEGDDGKADLLNVKPVHLTFEIYPKSLPKTCTNFLALCHGGLSLHGRNMQYKGSSLHEIVPDWCVVGGDFLNGNGTGGQSIFENNEFEDETFEAVDYSESGLLCMLSHGPHTNTSIFFITLKPAEWIKGLYVAFGKVVDGLEDLRQLAKEAGSETGVPTKTIKITSCGPL